MAFTSPLPSDTALVSSTTDRQSGKSRLSGFASSDWINWFLELVNRMNRAPEKIGAVSLTNQSASIGATSIGIPAPSTGRFRVGYYIRQTQAATTSASLTVTMGWTDDGVSCTQAGAALTGNTTATQQNGTLTVKADQATGLTYSVTYASVGATPCKFKFEAIVEALPN